VYPYPHVDEVLELMAEGRVLPYLDVPFQHSHPRVLKAMKRPASGEANIERIRKWRSVCPDLTIRSTFIAGFPGETDEEFEHLLEFIAEAELDRVGCFAYSPVQGASANALEGHVPDGLREERRQRLMELQAGISERRLQRFVGRDIQVLVDARIRDADGNTSFLARSPADAPEIDGRVILDEAPGLRVGEFATVRIVDSDEHDLYDEAIATGA